MAIIYQCPNCKKKVEEDKELVLKICPGCQETMVIVDQETCKHYNTKKVFLEGGVFGIKCLDCGKTKRRQWQGD